MAMLSDSADQTGLHQGIASGLSSMAWAGGQVLGGLLAGVGAEAFGDATPCLAIAAAMLVVGVASRRLAREHRPLAEPGA